MGDLESTGFSSNFGANVSFDREICGNLTEDYKKVPILYINQVSSSNIFQEK